MRRVYLCALIVGALALAACEPAAPGVTDPAPTTSAPATTAPPAPVTAAPTTPAPTTTAKPTTTAAPTTTAKPTTTTAKPATTTAAPTTTSPPASGTTPVGAAATTNYAIPSGALFVAPAGSDSAAGSQAAPLKTISAAVSKATSGQTIVVRAGTYHESINTGSKKVIVQAYPGERPVLDGAKTITGFVADSSKYSATYGISIAPNTETSRVSNPMASYYDQVWLDGVELTQVLTVAEVTSTSFAVVSGKLYLGVNPSGRKVEASEYTIGFKTVAEGTALKGLTIRRFSSKNAEAAVLLMGSNNLAEHLIVEDTTYGGIKLSDDDPSVGTTGTTVRDSTLRRNGSVGMNVYKADNVLFERNLVEQNNVDGWNTGQEAGGIKVVQSRGGVYQDNLVRNNPSKGFWFDQSAINITVARNTFVNNQPDNIMIEICAHFDVYGNVMMGAIRNGIRLIDSNDVDVWNNIVLDNGQDDIWIADELSRNLDKLSGAYSGGDRDLRAGETWPARATRDGITWTARDTTVKNNVIGDLANGSYNGTSPALIAWAAANDSDNSSSVNDKNIVVNNNAYWRRSATSTTNISSWDKGSSTSYAKTFSNHQTLGYDVNGQSVDGGTNPYLTGSSASTRVVGSGFVATGGAPLATAPAIALGVATNSKILGVPSSVKVLTPR